MGLAQWLMLFLLGVRVVAAAYYHGRFMRVTLGYQLFYVAIYVAILIYGGFFG